MCLALFACAPWAAAGAVVQLGERLVGGLAPLFYALAAVAFLGVFFGGAFLFAPLDRALGRWLRRPLERLAARHPGARVEPNECGGALALEWGERRAGVEAIGREDAVLVWVDVPDSLAAPVAVEAGAVTLRGLLRAVTGRTLDEAHAVVGGAKAPGAALLQSARVEAALGRLLAQGFDRVAVERRDERSRRVVARKDQTLLRRDLTPARLAAALDALSDLAAACERKEVPSPSGRLRFAWAPAGGAACCPFCHDALAVDAPDAQGCEGCGTLHHAECLREGGGCAIYGCGARAPRRELT